MLQDPVKGVKRNQGEKPFLPVISTDKVDIAPTDKGKYFKGPCLLSQNKQKVILKLRTNKTLLTFDYSSSTCNLYIHLNHI